MFHTSASTTPSGYPDSSSSNFHHQHLHQQPPVYVPSSRALPSQYPSSGGGGHFGPGAHQATATWPHATDPASYVGSGHSLAANPHHASALSAGQFYAQNMMMSSWRAYDGTGFQRTSPYGKLKINKYTI